MSTLKVATIQDTSGNNSSTPEQVAQGRAKAWVNFNGTGTVAIRDSFNVSSITDINTGIYDVNFTSSFANTNYAVSFTAGDPDNSAGPRGFKTPYFMRTSAIRLDSRGEGGGEEDAETVSVVIFAD
tara:strand:- start:42 stop:419 length:378 start_codon:yes stop_codon:yes gene_type:complete